MMRLFYLYRSAKETVEPYRLPVEKARLSDEIDFYSTETLHYISFMYGTDRGTVTESS